MSLLRFHRCVILLALASGCGDPTADPEPDCTMDRCNSAEDRDELLAQIEGFSDPISSFLRAAALDDGTLEGNYQQILDGVGAEMGCVAETQRSFMVLSNESLNPKTIFNRCASSPIQASEFYLLLPSLNIERDIEPGLVHMTAWDAEAGRYRRYATFPRPDGGMNINVEPSFCLTCHGGPRELDTWQPLMNEMTNPWSQWNAEPGFVSHVFDEFMPTDAASGTTFAEVSAQGLLDSASNFEPIIRAGIDRVTGARVQTRHDPVDKGEALELLQPLFCDEHVNFVSEIHGSGEIRSSALVDSSFRELFTALDVATELGFVEDATMRIPARAPEESNLTLMAVRGESTLRTELALVTRQALTALQVLQVRSLDWLRPVASDFRCGLFEAGEQRILGGAVDEALAGLGEGATNADSLSILLAEIMTFQGEGMRLSLQPPGNRVYSLPDVSAAEAAEAIDAADLSAFQTAPAELAAEIQARIESASRADLDARRRTRACDAVDRYLTAPLFPDILCE